MGDAAIGAALITGNHMFLYARYHRRTALVAPSNGEPLDATQAKRLAQRLRKRYPLAGLKFWEQPEPNPTVTATWEALRETVVYAMTQPPEEPPSAPPMLSERQAAAYLGIQLDSLRHEINTGRLECSGTRRHRRFAVSELDRWRSHTGAANKDAAE
jgi:excisionase family DNA binding protein